MEENGPDQTSRSLVPFQNTEYNYVSDESGHLGFKINTRHFSRIVRTVYSLFWLRYNLHPAEFHLLSAFSMRCLRHAVSVCSDAIVAIEIMIREATRALRHQINPWETAI